MCLVIFDESNGEFPHCTFRRSDPALPVNPTGNPSVLGVLGVLGAMGPLMLNVFGIQRENMRSCVSIVEAPNSLGREVFFEIV